MQLWSHFPVRGDQFTVIRFIVILPVHDQRVTVHVGVAVVLT